MSKFSQSGIFFEISQKILKNSKNISQKILKIVKIFFSNKNMGKYRKTRNMEKGKTLEKKIFFHQKYVKNKILSQVENIEKP